MPAKAELGAVLARIRASHKWTLAEVARRSGLSISTLSKVERGQLSLTYDKLLMLAKGLDVDIAVLFGAESTTATLGEPVSLSGRRSINRSEAGALVETDRYSQTYLCTDLRDKKFVPMLGDVKARSLAEFGPLTSHSGDEFVYVLEGVLELHTEVYAPLRLVAGESVYFDSQMPHGYINGGGGICRTLCICSSPEQMLFEITGQPTVRLPAGSVGKGGQRRRA